MEQLKSVPPSSQYDVDIKKLIEERREARKQKLLARLGRNLTNPVSVTSLEALTGTLRSKNQPITPAIIMPANNGPKPLTKQKEAIIPARKTQVKRAISLHHTNTSQRRITMAQQGLLPSELSAKPIASTEGKSTTAPLPQVTKLQRQRLTVPHSPNFSTRKRQPLTSKSASKPLYKPAVKVQPKSILALKAAPSKSVSTDKSEDSAANVKEKSTFMFPLTPEDKVKNANGLVKSIASPRTPNVKPFARKSFSESKDNNKSIARFARSMSTASLARSNSTLASRKSVAPSTFSRASRSMWPVQKEPSEKEKIQQWLEKRGRSVTSCRHLGCLGHRLKEFDISSPAKPKTVRKSIIVAKKEIELGSHASPKLKKRQSNELNRTFEKEDEFPEASSTPPPFKSELQEEQVAEKECSSEIPAQPATQEEENGEPTPRFLTPRGENCDLAFDLTDLQEGRVEKLLETIAALLNEPIYPGAKIQSWLMESEARFPLVKTHALYWDIRARLEERRGNHMEALDIYSEAIEKQAEPLDTMKQMFDNFLLRIGSNIPTGQRTPLLKSLGVETPMIRRRLTTPRRPLLDSTQVFQSTTVKYEIKLKQIFEEHMKENTDANIVKKPLKTPIKLKKDSDRVSLAWEGAYQLVATPVRRSMRPKAVNSMAKVEGVAYVDDLEQLSPTTKAKAVLRHNKALSFD